MRNVKQKTRRKDKQGLQKGAKDVVEATLHAGSLGGGTRKRRA